MLRAKDIRTVDDLLHYLPFRYEDRLNPRSVAELRAGEMADVYKRQVQGRLGPAGRFRDLHGDLCGGEMREAVKYVE